MRLLIYSHYFAPSIGGVETIVMSLARGLSEIPDRAFEPTVVTEFEAGPFDDSSLPFPVVRKPSLMTLLNLIRKSDVVHIAGPAMAPMLACYILRKPFVVEHHGYQSICPNGLLILQPERPICPGYFQARQYAKCVSCRAAETSFPKALLSVLAMFPRHFLSTRVPVNIAISQHVINRQELPNNRLILYGIEERPVLPPAASKAHQTFAFVGRFVPEKGIPVLLRACAVLKATHPDFRLRMIGDGPERKVAEEMIASLQLQDVVELTGFRSGRALDDALADVGALVMPSVWEETAGLSAIEHMMRGRLVIASDVGGLAEMVGDAGLLSKVNSPESVAGCMLLVIRNPQLIDELGRKARDRALRLFGRSRMLEDHVKTYLSIARPRQATSSAQQKSLPAPAQSFSGSPGESAPPHDALEISAPPFQQSPESPDSPPPASASRPA
jgi:glycogen synthase